MYYTWFDVSPRVVLESIWIPCLAWSSAARRFFLSQYTQKHMNTRSANRHNLPGSSGVSLAANPRVYCYCLSWLDVVTYAIPRSSHHKIVTLLPASWGMSVAPILINPATAILNPGASRTARAENRSRGILLFVSSKALISARSSKMHHAGCNKIWLICFK